MHSLAEDVIGGFNRYMEGLAKDAVHDYQVTVALFHTTVEFLCENIPPAGVPRLTVDNYVPLGGTALHDAVGDLISRHTASGKDKVLVVVNTDGKENSSREWNRKSVGALIKAKTELGWGFVFLGAGVDNWQEGERLGMFSGQTMATKSGTRGSFSGLTVGTVAYAAGASAQSVVSTASQWSAAADAVGEDNHGQ
jgi:hypothetical protein